MLRFQSTILGISVLLLSIGCQTNARNLELEEKSISRREIRELLAKPANVVFIVGKNLFGEPPTPITSEENKTSPPILTHHGWAEGMVIVCKGKSVPDSVLKRIAVGTRLVVYIVTPEEMRRIIQVAAELGVFDYYEKSIVTTGLPDYKFLLISTKSKILFSLTSDLPKHWKMQKEFREKVEAMLTKE